MKGLRGARVLLVDDDINEAVPILKAFSKAGVSVAYFDGTIGGLPAGSKRLRGVRLAILDMDLGVGGSEENVAATLVQTVSQIISPDNGPYGILIWTNRPELKDLVTKYIFERTELQNPVFVLMLKKAGFITNTGSADAPRFAIAKLSNRLFNNTSENSPLECLLVWEELTFRAATNVTNSVAELTGSVATSLAEWKKSWQEEALRLLFVISKAQAEDLHAADTCIPALFLALNPLHSDRLELLVDEMPDDLSGHAAGIMAATGGSKVERKAKVNSMLHLASDRLTKFNPGNLYVFGKRKRLQFVPSLNEILPSTVEGSSGEKKEANLKELVPVVHLCGVEITPVCDHAQGKMGVSKIIVGFLVPHEHSKKIKKADSLKRIGPLYFTGKRLFTEGAYNLYLDSRFVASAKPAQVKTLRATFRVRPQLLADIQSWAAYQGARQGVMLLS